MGTLNEKEEKDLTAFVKADLENIEPYVGRIIRETKEFGLTVSKGKTLEIVLSGYAYGYRTFDLLLELAKKERDGGGDICEIIKASTLEAISESKYKIEGYKIGGGAGDDVESCYRHFRNEFIEAIGLGDYIKKFEENYSRK